MATRAFGAMYLPRITCAHNARIALKKFRYAVEIADATGLVPAQRAIRELKKGQDVLGELHDRQELVCNADGLAFPVRDGIPVMLEGEARALGRETGPTAPVATPY